jgi:hypothetical protein
MAQLEKRGLATVTWTAERFVTDARVSARVFGLNAISLAHLPEPATNQTEDVIKKMVDASIDQVIQGLTITEQPTLSDVKSKPSEILKFQGEDLLDAVETMTKYFLKEAWSDGFPMIPPTSAAVERMLSGTILPREEVVCLLEPGFGIASVEKIAINAVMAGCRPEHLPVVITAVQCLGDPMMATRHGSMSTGPQAPLIVVNGPIAIKANINAKSCALGPGSISYANTVIGRALRLIMMNIGQCYPGIADMDTLGSPIKYSMCLAENQDDNPWEPYSVDKGYDKDTSTVTVHFNYGLCDVHDPFSTTPEGLIETFSSIAAQPVRPAFGRWLSTGRGAAKSTSSSTFHDMIILCPDHARIFGKHNWNKQKIQEAIHAHARLPLQAFFNHGYKSALEKFHPELLSAKENPKSTVPALAGPACYDIVIAGTDVGRSCFTWGFYEPVTKPVKS